jgi:AraC-like DNA-binding protein
VQYGPCVDIQPGYLKDFFLLQIPLRGGADVRCGGQQVRADLNLASLPSPTEPLTMRWADDSPHLIVKFSRTALQAQLERLAQKRLSAPLVFDLGVPLGDPALAPLLHFIRCLQATLDAGEGLGGPLLAEQAESYLMASLLLCAPHNHSAALRGGAPRTWLPRAVRRAEEYMASRLDSAVSLADVCEHAGVSARALQSAFRQHRGHGPMEFLRNARLDGVRAALLDALREAAPVAASAGAVRVSDIAARYGFGHAGRFAADYRLRFGEAPSQTLTRSAH